MKKKVENLAKNYKVGDKLEYSFTEIPDYRLVEIEELTSSHAKFKNKTGHWVLNEKFIKPKDFQPGNKIKSITYFGQLAY